MKKLSNCISTVKDGKLTMTADVVDAEKGEFYFPLQHKTVGYIHPNHQRHPRHVQISDNGVFVRTLNAGFVMTLDDFVEMAGKVEPKTLPPPSFKTFPSATSLTAELAPELEAQIQWKWANSHRGDDKWTNIEGATALTLKPMDHLKGKWVSCVAESESGAIATPPILI